METCENGKKIPERSRSVLGRFYCIYADFVPLINILHTNLLQYRLFMHMVRYSVTVATYMKTAGSSTTAVTIRRRR